MIEAQELSFNPAFEKISFNLPEGQCLAVIGHNGAGKTTLFHVLLSLKFASSGNFSLDEKRIGFVPERPYLEMESNLIEFLTLHLKLIHYPASQITNEITRVTKLVGLEVGQNQKFKNYSKGMLQKALLAQSMLGSPKLIILDEPLSGLDPESRKEIMGFLQDLKKQGTTLMFSSHVMEDVALLSDLVLVLDHGSQKFFGTVADWSAK